MKKLVVCAAMLLAAGCAKRPEEITATPVTADPYMQMQCAQLSTLKVQKEAELAGLEKEQTKAADQDSASMAVIHVPVASMSGKDKEPEIAKAKGEVQAIGSAYQAKGCGAG
jgi:hypothetical protein